MVDALQRHTEAGRLTLDEFTERVDSAYAARTLGELAAVTRDLPAEAAVAAGPGTADTGRRDLLVIFAVAGVALVLLIVFMALTR